MQIKTAEFIISNTDPNLCPPAILPEYAFIGRSNVGKSSLINMLAQRKKLAKISGKPGKTQLINHFLINKGEKAEEKAWYLVDLPGYGFAKASKKDKSQWDKFIRKYLLMRKNLLTIFVLIDVRLEPQKIDLEFMEWLATSRLAFVMVFTKADKLGKTQLAKNLANYRKIMSETWENLPPQFVTSSAHAVGRDEVLDYIEETSTIFYD